MSEPRLGASTPAGDRPPGAGGDRFALDVVGVGALNLDYIAHASAVALHGSGTGLSARIAETVARGGVVVESGAEALVDEATVRSVLELAGTGAPPTAVLGGSAFNAVQAIAQSNVGLRLGYVGVAGRVPVLGVSVTRQLDALGVDRRCVREDEDRLCGICFSYAENGERTLLTHVGANSGMAEYLDSAFDVIVAYLSSARLVHVTSFLDDHTAARLVSVLRAVRKASPETRICLDPGHVWSTGRTPGVAGLVALSDYLLLNYREFRELGDRPAETPDEEVAAGILGRVENERAVIVVKRPSGILAFRRPAEGGAEAADAGAEVAGGAVDSAPGNVPGKEGSPGASAVREFYPQLPLAEHEVEDATGAGDVFAAGLLTVLASDHLQLELGSLLGMRLARHKLRHVGMQGTRFADVARDFIASLDAQRRSGGGSGGIFIAHGGSPVWLAVRQFVQERLKVPVYSFESRSWGGRQVTEALTEYLERCSFAICVLTGEDLTEDGRRLARQNVIHEVGLFQGRYGFDRVLVLAEEGCAFVPKAAEPYTITFPAEAVSRAFYPVETALREKGFGDGEGM